MLISFGITQDVTKGYLGMIGGMIKGMSPMLLDWCLGEKVKVYAIGISKNCKHANILADWALMLKLYEQQKLHPVLGPAFDFEDAKSAHKHMDQRQGAGKMILVNQKSN